MANVKIDEAVMTALANLLREFKGDASRYFPSEMEPAFRALLAAGGGGDVVDAVLVPLEITQNGTYTPPDGAHGFSSVNVNVEQVAEEPVLAPLEIAQNGVYVPGNGVDGFSTVTVNVPAAGVERGVVVNTVDADGNWLDVSIYGSFPSTLFQENTYIQKVSLFGVTEIPKNAFVGCTALAHISFTNELVAIGEYAFDGSGLTEITIPYNMVSVGNRAFRNCSKLTSVKWYARSATAGSSNYPSFQGCSALAEFIIGEEVEDIPAYLLYGGVGVQSLTIPASVTSVGNRAFANCTSLTTVNWNAPNIETIGSANYPVFQNCSALVDFNIADNVVSVPGYMLRGCTGIVNIVVPDSVQTIGTQAFYGCSKLVSAQIGESDACELQTIGNNAFASCSALADITIYKAADSISGSPWGASAATVTWAVS